MNTTQNSTLLAPVYVKLLQGFILNSQKKLWDTCVIHQESVRSYFSQMGLFLHLDLEDGFAFLKSASSESTDPDVLAASEDSEESQDFFQGASLIRRIPFGFDLSLLSVLLRESLEQFDVETRDDHRLVLKKDDIYNMLKTFFGEASDEIKQHRRFDILINKVIELGFLRELGAKSGSFEVIRIIKAFVDATKLAEIKAKMHAHLNTKPDEEYFQ